MRILCDVDGVFADFTTHALNSLGDLAPEGGADAITNWDILSLLSEEGRETCYRLWREAGWCSGLPLYQESLGFYEKLSSLGKVIWVTAPMVDAPYWTHERTLWLQKHFGAELDDIVFTHDKSHVWGGVLIDDKVENVEKWSRTHPQGLGLLWDQPYNQKWSPSRNSLRVRSTTEVVSAITKFRVSRILGH